MCESQRAFWVLEGGVSLMWQWSVLIERYFLGLTFYLEWWQQSNMAERGRGKVLCKKESLTSPPWEQSIF